MEISGPKTADLDFTRKVLEFTDTLSERKHACWEDKYGKYEVFFFDDGADQKLAEFENADFIISDNLHNIPAFQRYLKKQSSKAGNCIISIGAFYAHNLAKIRAQQRNAFLITVPVPLSNDSFGTNRCNISDEPSFRCVFPNITLVDPFFLSLLSRTFNLKGMGEFVGLYFSLVDYCITRKLHIPEELLNFIADKFKVLSSLYKNNYEDFLFELSVALILKCVIMRANEDHQIGCGMDHLFCGYIQRTQNLPHGESVYLGSILSLALYPDLQKFGVSLNNLINTGLELKLISMNNLSLCLNYKTIVGAIKFRNNRKTILKDINESQCIKAFGNIREHL